MRACVRVYVGCFFFIDCVRVCSCVFVGVWYCSLVFGDVTWRSFVVHCWYVMLSYIFDCSCAIRLFYLLSCYARCHTRHLSISLLFGMLGYVMLFDRMCCDCVFVFVLCSLLFVRIRCVGVLYYVCFGMRIRCSRGIV